MRCSISRSALDAIVSAAAADPGREVCGLLLGSAASVTDLIPTANVAADPEARFEIDPAALFRALRAERAGGAAVAGCYHSHPGGDAMPSRTDAELALPDGKLWLIVAGARVTAWRAVAAGALHGRFDAVALEISAVAGG